MPIDLGGTRQSGIAASTYHQLKQRLGLHTPTRVYDLYQMLAEVEQPVLERFGADVVGLNRPAVAFGIRNERWKPWRFSTARRWKCPAGSSRRSSPTAICCCCARRRHARWPACPTAGSTSTGSTSIPARPTPIRRRSSCRCSRPRNATICTRRPRRYAQNTDLAIIAAMGPPYELFFGLGTGDFQAWMITLATEPDYVAALYERLIEAWLENLRRFHAAVGDRVADPAVQRRPGHAGRPVPLRRACSASGSCPTTSAGSTGSTSTRG